MTSNYIKKSLPTIIIMAVFSVVMIGIIYSILSPDKRLPVYNPADVNPRLVDESIFHIRTDHKVADFSLTNQNGKTITQKDYEGKIYVADFFFTKCQTICPIMTNNMVKIQEQFSEDPNVMFLSLSVTPEMNSIPVLREYADKYKITIFVVSHETLPEEFFDQRISVTMPSHFSEMTVSSNIRQEQEPAVVN